MARLRLYSLLNKWSRIRFSRIKVVQLPHEAADPQKMELYLCDGREPAAWLFICRLEDENDKQGVIARYQRWLEAYYEPEKTNEALTDNEERLLASAIRSEASSYRQSSVTVAGWTGRASEAATYNSSHLSVRY
uniref:hypothetical protein n=1 Tax=Pantoea sp. IMH TaxID=1267600 RepID=UPI00046ACC9D|nr:hypothetical protein [Pantoea sp. IMH]